MEAPWRFVEVSMKVCGAPWRSPWRSVEAPWRSVSMEVSEGLHGVPDNVGRRHHASGAVLLFSVRTLSSF